MSASQREAKGILSLPGSLKEALDTLRGDKLMMDARGVSVAEHYLQGKEKEWDEYRTRVTDWEVRKYLGMY